MQAEPGTLLTTQSFPQKNGALPLSPEPPARYDKIKVKVGGWLKSNWQDQPKGLIISSPGFFIVTGEKLAMEKNHKKGTRLQEEGNAKAVQ